MFDLYGRPVADTVYDNFMNEGNGVCTIKAPSWEALKDIFRHLPYDLSNTPLSYVREFWWNGRLYATVG